MREIKFRAWHIERKQMWYAAEQAYDYISGHEHPANNGDAVPATYFGEMVGSPNEWTLMQFIGLHDKNGVEIYEGDILQPLYNNIPAFEVKFEDGAFNCHRFNLPNCKVLGNGFEHPELLK